MNAQLIHNSILKSRLIDPIGEIKLEGIRFFEMDVLYLFLKLLLQFLLQDILLPFRRKVREKEREQERGEANFKNPLLISTTVDTVSI